MQENGFHITIGSTSEEANFENDLRLVKASLLYADKIKLCSPLSSEAIRYLTIIESNSKKQLEFVESFAKFHIDQQEFRNFLYDLENYKSILRKKHPTPREIRTKINVENFIKKSFLGMKGIWLHTIEEFGMSEILPLIELRILEIHPLGNPTTFDYHIVVEEFVKFLGKTISDQNTYPLFNDQVGNLVKLGIKEEKITVSESGVARGKHSALAANLLERLPLFDEAKVDEILDIRKELERPLKRFRSLMIKFSEEIKNASWDEDFSHDAETVFRRDIEPVVLDIEDAISSNSYLAKLTRKIADKPLNIPAGSALGLLMSPLSELPMLMTTSLGVGVSASIIAYDAYKEWEQTNLKTEQNNLFFYYKAKEILAKLK